MPELSEDVKLGFHWRVKLRRRPRHVNIPYWPHRIIVISWGRLGNDGKFRRYQPCIRKRKLDYCCEERIRQHAHE
jgi:hypothetical protein